MKVVRKFVLYVVEDTAEPHKTALVQDLATGVLGHEGEREISMIEIQPHDVSGLSDEALGQELIYQKQKDARNLAPVPGDRRDFISRLYKETIPR